MRPAEAGIHTLLASARLDQHRKAVRIGAVVMTDAQLETMLRDESDATARNGALEMIKVRGERGRHLALRLLDDEDGDVALQAVLALDALQQESDLTVLSRLAENANINIAQASILAIGHSRHPNAQQVARAFASREPWLAAAAIEALGSLGSPSSLPLLCSRVEDPVVGPLAIDAIARIGGQEALDALASMWLTAPRESLESHDLLQALVTTAEAADRLLFAAPRLREEIGRRSGESHGIEHELLIRAGIALGRHEVTVATIQQFIDTAGGAANEMPLPAAFRHHPELAYALLASAPRWALALASEFGERIDRNVLRALLTSMIDGDLPESDLPLLLTALQASDSLPRGAAAAITDGVASRNSVARALFRGLLTHFSSELAGELGRYTETPMAEHALIAAAEARFIGRLADEIERLPRDERASTLDELAPWADAITVLPWERWIDEMPELLPVAARLSRSAPLPRLLPLFRDALQRDPAADIIDAVIAAGDAAGETILVEHALRQGHHLVLEALGRCRGEASLSVLRSIAANREHWARAIAVRALARRASIHDLSLFLESMADPDWLVRHACVRALARCTENPQAIEALVRLANDPVNLVSEAAVSAVEGHR
jgi:HEAT repeat protein